MGMGKNRMFITFLAILGVILMVTAWQIDRAIEGCVSKNLHNANLVCLVLGVMLVTSSLSFILAQRAYKGSPALAEANNNIFMAVVAMIGVTVMVLGSIIQGEANSGSCNVHGHAKTLIAIGVTGVVISLVYYALPMIKRKRIELP